MRREDIVNAYYAREMDEKKAFLQRTRQECEKAEAGLQNLKKEVVKSLIGESAFFPEILNSAIQEQEKRCVELRYTLATTERELMDGESRLVSIGRQYDDFLEWSAAYDAASMSAKKMIISRIIERVDVCRGYQLNVKLNISVEQFMVNLEAATS